jgi:hypothetical protein
VVTDEERKAVWTRNGLLAVALVDGRVAATWKLSRARKTATLTVDPLKRIAKKDRAALAEEGEQLLAFAEPEATSRAVQFA